MSQPVAITPSPNLNISALKASCSACSMHQLCLPMGLGESDMTRLDDIIGRRRKIPKDTHLYRIGDHFTNLYAIRLCHFKTFQVSPAGEQQVTGFQMAGELLGMDAISTEHHHCDAMALEDSEVCEIPFARLEELFGTIPSLLHHFHRMMSQEIALYLSRHGIKVNVICRDTRVNEGEALLSYCADETMDLIVMGGYGHTRFREMVLGGATREILLSMTIPVLMSH